MAFQVFRSTNVGPQILQCYPWAAVKSMCICHGCTGDAHKEKDGARLFLSSQNDRARKIEGIHNFQNRHRKNERIMGFLSQITRFYHYSPKVTMVLCTEGYSRL